ncbi:trans-2-enoyl-CoA reductase family protein [Lactobacillus sp. XV13L]|nr:trans-2-enoyl-CoA reductase family protein [Lactobacillus sp. XV13L]
MSKNLVEIHEKLQGNVARSVNPYGCQQEVINQINYVKNKGEYKGAKKVLVIGASSSYGLASRITQAFGAGADTIGVSFERPVKDKTMLGTPGWWNNIYFKQEAQKQGLIAKNFLGDAFTHQMKQQVIKYIQTEFGGQIDLLIYSVAAPKRTNPDNPDEVWRSQIKPIGQDVSGYNINLEKNALFYQTIAAASQQEIAATIKVMGGEDWEIWVKELKAAGVLASGFKTILYSYIGSPATYAFYHEGTLGRAKAAAEKSAYKIQKHINDIKGQALISVSTAVTTKASVVIPIFPVYCIALYKVMLKKGTHETPIMQKDRLFRDMVYGKKAQIDSRGRLRPDAWELDSDTQKQTVDLMNKITPTNFNTDLTAYDTFRKEFLQINGFEVAGIDNTTVNYDEITKLKP